MAKIKQSELDTIGELAAKGYSVKDIAAVVGVHVGTLYKGEKRKYLLRGRSEARRRAIDALNKVSIEAMNVQALLFLIRKLNAFDEPIGIKKPESAKDVPEFIAQLIQKEMDGEITAEKADRLRAAAMDYVKAVEVAELEENVRYLMETIDEEGNRK